MSDFHALKSDDVIKIEARKVCEVNEIAEEIALVTHNRTNFSEVFSGIECRVLRSGHGWQSGTIKAKVVIEFYPNEGTATSSELDDIRELSL